MNEILDKLDLIEYGLYSADMSIEVLVIFRLIQEIRELLEGEDDVQDA
jgi:hypothetical protein